MAGTLFVVATPIGNLEDITLRALRVLREVDSIAAEDTRHTLKLLSHYEISKPMVSLREHNEARQGARLIEQIQSGKSVALVSDAGTPGIADPGARLVRAAREAGVKVSPIPGPSSVTAALSIAGLESPEFVFLGFPPQSSGQRRNWLESLQRIPWSLVILEAPHRVHATLIEIEEILANRDITIARELTKINEELVNKSIKSGARGEARGEYVILAGPPREPSAVSLETSSNAVTRIYELLAEQQNTTIDQVVLLLADCSGVKPERIAKLIKKHKISVKQQNKADLT